MATMTATKHKHDCSRVFKNYDMSCPRCVELAEGAKPRDGWQRQYYGNKKVEEARFMKQLKAHDCVKSNCGVVCTAFDW